jgi:hypothetical protein
MAPVGAGRFDHVVNGSPGQWIVSVAVVEWMAAFLVTVLSITVEATAIDWAPVGRMTR